MRFIRMVMLPFLLWSSAGLAAGTGRYIDRPIGPAVGGSDLVVTGGFLGHRGIGDFSSSPENQYFVDVTYRKAISDDYTLIWSPFPIGILYKLDPASPNTAAAVSWRVDFLNYGKWGVGPRFNSYYRTHLAPNFGLESLLEYSTFTPFGREPSVWSLALSMRFPYQVDDRLAILPGVALSFYDNVLKKIFVDEGNSSAQDKIKFVMPVSIAFDYRWSESTRLAAGYTYYGAAVSREFETHLMEATLIKEW